MSMPSPDSSQSSSSPSSPPPPFLSERQITFAQAIQEGTAQAMAADVNVFVMGLGVDDPKAIFGTTSGLSEQFGPERVFDVPVSENALTGAAIGAATFGMRPILTHQRIDFALLSLDQIINNAAKWHYMFGGKLKCPIVVRMLIGRGWGQGPQHSQSYQSLLAHIPGLKVVMPATPHDGKGLLVAAIEDDNPVMFLEHRWLHNIKGPVPEAIFREPIGKARLVRSGKDVTIVAVSYMVFEAYRAAETLARYGVEAEVIDLRTLRPLDGEAILQSVRKTGRLVIADTGHKSFGISAEISAFAVENLFTLLKGPPLRVASPDIAVPSSYGLADDYYPRASTLVKQIWGMLGGHADLGERIFKEVTELEQKLPHDVPDLSFGGPF